MTLENGDLFGWGCNEVGLVNPASWGSTYYKPRHIPLPPDIGKVKDVALGDMSALILNSKSIYVFTPYFLLIFLAHLS